MAKDVKFNIKLTIDGKQQIVEASTNVKGFAEQLAIAQTKGNRLRDSLLKFNGIANAFSNLSSGLQQLTGVAQTYIDANKVQVEAETKLTTVMRERLGATDAEIQSIKELTAAQQQLGVIGDEVQLMGAQQLATFLSQKSSLDVLIPAMNNLLAQQKGLNATGQDAVNVGNMIGKVMQGQVGALTRAGITFTEAQKEVIKYGNETERAAALAEVITANVGQMNAELAKTDAGAAKQAANALGDMQEKWGSFIAKYEKDIVVFSQGMMAISASMNVIQGLRGAVSALGAVFGGLVGLSKKAVAGVKALAVGMKTLAASSRAAGLAIKGALISSGIGIAIVAITTAIGALTNKLDDASAAVEDLKEADDAYVQAAGQAQVEMDGEVSKLGALIKSHGDAAEAVNHLNEKYGDYFGTCNTAQGWYDKLISKSKEYVTQIGLEAKARVLGEKMAEAAAKKALAEQKKEEMERTGPVQRRKNSWTYTLVDTKEYAAVKEEISLYEDESAQLQKEADLIAAAMAKVTASLKDAGSGSDGTSGGHTPLSTTVKSAEQAKSATTELNTELDVSKLTWRELETQIRAVDNAMKDTLDPQKWEQLRAYRKELSTQQGKVGALAGIGGEASPDLFRDDAGVIRVKPVLDDNDFIQAMERLGKTWGDNAFSTMREQLGQLTEGMTEYGDAAKQAQGKQAGMSEGIASMTGLMSQLGQAVGGEAGQWLQWGANLTSAIAQAIPMIGQLAAAKNAETNENVQSMAAKAGDSVAGVPFVGPVLAVAAIASVLAAMLAIPKFAKGGIAYGPTLGLFGEYAGAGHNPEVVAPLDRLRSMLHPAGFGGTVRFEVRGRSLVGVMGNETRVASKSGRRTGIKI